MAQLSIGALPVLQIFEDRQALALGGITIELPTAQFAMLLWLAKCVLQQHTVDLRNVADIQSFLSAYAAVSQESLYYEKAAENLKKNPEDFIKYFRENRSKLRDKLLACFGENVEKHLSIIKVGKRNDLRYQLGLLPSEFVII